MKKYIKPEMEIVVMKHQTALLAGSPELGGTYGGNQVLSPIFLDEFDNK